MIDPKEDQIKSLIINGKTYAKYVIDDVLDVQILFLKVLINIIPDSVGKSEDYLAAIIGTIEEKNFEGISFLNI